MVPGTKIYSAALEGGRRVNEKVYVRTKEQFPKKILHIFMEYSTVFVENA